MGDVMDAFVEYGRVMYLKCGDVRMVRVVVFVYFHVGGSDKQLLYQNDGKNDAYYTQRVSYSTAQGSSAGGFSQLFQCLLGSSERGRVGGCSAQDAYHVGQADRGDECQSDGCQCSEQDYSQTKHVELESSVFERTEESGTYLQA